MTDPRLRDKLSRLMHLVDGLAGMTEEEIVTAFDDDDLLEQMLSPLEALYLHADSIDATVPLSKYGELLSTDGLDPEFRDRALRHLERLDLQPRPVR